MNALRNLLTRPLTTRDEDATVSSIAAYVAAILVLVCGFISVGLLGVEITGTFLVILGVLSVSLLFVLLGQLGEINQRLRSIENKKP